jgi:hypothetical protein
MEEEVEAGRIAYKGMDSGEWTSKALEEECSQ